MFTRSKLAPQAASLLAAIPCTAALGLALPKSDQTSTILDPVGDTYLVNAPAFQDIVRAQVTKTADGDFHLLMEMAGNVPENPPLPPPGVREIWWQWGFDFDPNTFPAGYPYPGPGLRAEFLAYVRWDGTDFAGILIDRRPLLTGGEALITSVPISIDGTIVEAVLASELLGDVPPSFVWGPATRDWSGPVGSNGSNSLDDAITIFSP
jgi:hypothetical protein